MSIESMVFEYWKAVTSPHRHREIVDSCLYWVRDGVQPVIERMGYTWDEKMEQILIDAALNYSSSWCMSFMEFFMRRLKNSVKSTIVGG